jgi:hypothetical protein
MCAVITSAMAARHRPGNRDLDHRADAAGEPVAAVSAETVGGA